jgi:hypothetical protein
MKLGKLIEVLGTLSPEKKLEQGLATPHSYRGYYDELAFEPVRNTTVGEMLAAAESAVGEVYRGYKGGGFEMTEDTDVHIAFQGSTGDKLTTGILAAMVW